MMLHLARAGSGDQLGESFASDAGERKIDDIGIAKEVVKKRFYCLRAVGSAQLE
jgi:hypothetical protein